MSVAMGTESTPLMSPGQIGDEMMLCTGRFIINELVNGLMADMEFWAIFRQSACDQFGRPFEFEFVHDIPTDQRVTYPLSLNRFVFPFKGSFMGLVGQVDIVSGRSVPFEFSRNAPFVSPDTFGYV